MSLHGCNYLCSLHPGLHAAQRRLLPMEGHEDNARELLIAALEAEIEQDMEMLQILTPPHDPEH